MSMHYRFPASTELNRRLPKETFYQRLNPTSALRQAFVTQVQEIIWRNKLAADTLNITEEVLRYLLVSVDPKSVKAAEEAQEKIETAVAEEN